MVDNCKSVGIQQSLRFGTRSLSIIELTQNDAKRQTDDLVALRHLVIPNEVMYPDIGRWFDRKVVPGVANGERAALIGVVDGKPAVAAIVKRGSTTKFCHLKVDP